MLLNLKHRLKKNNMSFSAFIRLCVAVIFALLALLQAVLPALRHSDYTLDVIALIACNAVIATVLFIFGAKRREKSNASSVGEQNGSASD